MLLDPQVLEVIALAAAAVAASAVLALAVLAARVSRLSRRCTALEASSRSPAGGFPVAALEALRTDLDTTRAEAAASREQLAGALQRVAVVRYDAFGEASGQQSFSAVLLDERGDGVVLTSISGRADSCTYVKRLRQGAATAPLSPEELETVAAASHGDDSAPASADRDRARSGR